MRPIIAAVLIILFFSPFLRAQDSRENAEFKMAIDLYKDGMYDLARDQLLAFVQKYPTTQSGVEARFYLGLVYLKTKNFEQAKNTFQDFAITYSDNPKAPDAWWNTGEAFAGMKNYAEAAAAFQRLKSFHPKSPRAPEALLQASSCYQRAGDMENAAVALRAILQEYPTSSEVLRARYEIGRLYTATGDYDRAFSELNRTAEGTTDQELKAKAVTAIGTLHGLMGNREEAEKRLREVITLYPNSVAADEAHVRLGDLQRQYQDFSEAVQNYNAVSARKDAAPEMRQEAFMGAAECSAANRDYAGALAIYRRYFQSVGETDIAPALYRKAAETARKAGDYSQAAEYYAQLLADSSGGIDRRGILHDAALTEFDAHRANAGIALLREYVSRYPADAGTPSALFAIAEQYENSFGNYSRALSIYNAILEQHGSSPVADDALYARGRCAWRLKRVDEAIESYEQLPVQFPGSPLIARADSALDSVRVSGDTDPQRALVRIAGILQLLPEGNAAAVEEQLGDLYREEIMDFRSANTHYDAAVTKGASGPLLERALYGRAVSEAMLAQRGEAPAADAVRMLGDFLKNYPASPLAPDAAYQRFLVRSRGRQGTEFIDPATEYLAANPTEHAAEVSVALADAKRDAGRSAEAETEYGAVMTRYPGTPAAASALFGRGIARITLGNFVPGGADLQAYLKDNPSGPRAAEATLALGRLAERQGEYEKAAAWYDEASRRFGYAPECRAADMRSVLALSEGGFHDRAAARAAALLKKERDNPFAPEGSVGDYLFLYAETLAKKKDITKAKSALQQYQSEFPNGRHISEVYFALGQIFKDEGKIALATSYFKQSGRQSGNPEASRDAADLLLESKRYDEAIAEYRKLAAAAANRQEKAYYASRIVVADFRANNSGAAQAAWNDFKTEFPDAEPNFDEFELERGKMFHRQKEYDRAISVFENITGSKTREIAARAALWIGKCHESMNHAQRATEQFARVMTDWPGTDAAIEASLSIGRIALRAEKWEDAAKAFRAVVDQPGIPAEFQKEALNGLISCYDELNIADGAAEMTKRFISLFPNDPSLFRKRVNLGIFYEKLGYYDQAVTHFENLLGEATADDQAELRFYIGECYFNKGDYTQSIIEFLKVKYLVTRRTEIDWTASAYHYAGLAYEKLAQYDKAITMYEMIRTGPNIDATFKAAAEKDINRVKALMR